MQAILLLMAAGACSDVALGVESVEIPALFSLDPVVAHGMRAGGDVCIFVNPNRPTRHAARHILNGRDTASDMAVQTERLKTMTTLTARIVFLARNVVHRNPIAGMIAHISCGAIMAAQAVVFFVAIVAIGFISLRGHGVVVEEIRVMDCVRMQPVRFEFAITKTRNESARRVRVMASCAFDRSALLRVAFHATIHGGEVVAGCNGFLRHAVVALDALHFGLGMSGVGEDDIGPRNIDFFNRDLVRRGRALRGGVIKIPVTTRALFDWGRRLFLANPFFVAAVATVVARNITVRGFFRVGDVFVAEIAVEPLAADARLFVGRSHMIIVIEVDRYVLLRKDHEIGTTFKNHRAAQSACG